MTESEWLKSSNPHALLTHLQRDAERSRPNLVTTVLGFLRGLTGEVVPPPPIKTVSERKLRLVACACCRLTWDLLTDPRSRKAVEVAELYADGQAKKAHLSRARRAALAVSEVPSPTPIWSPPWHASWIAIYPGARRTILGTARALSPGRRISMKVRKELSDLVREIFGNPFRPVAALPHWPLTVTQLAKAVYEGENCAFALHDALHEAGIQELADHFNDPEQRHPKGCWAVDAILGRE